MNYQLYKIKKEADRISKEASKFARWSDAKPFMEKEMERFLAPAVVFASHYVAGEVRAAGIPVSNDFLNAEEVRLEMVVPAQRVSHLKYGFKFRFLPAATSPPPPTHYERVAAYRKLWGQNVRDTPTIPSPEERELAVRLILEEAFEFAAAAGVDIKVEHQDGRPAHFIDFEDLGFKVFEALDFRQNALKDCADGLSDLQVVTTGAYQMFGFHPDDFVWSVDVNNMAKTFGHRDEATGKWIKPEGHEPPDLQEVIDHQMPSATDEDEEPTDDA